MEYPDQYLHVQEISTGKTWIEPLRGNASLDIKKQVKKWIKKEFCGEFALDGNLTPRLDGDYYAKIMTDNRPPESGIVWNSGGFYIKCLIH